MISLAHQGRAWASASGSPASVSQLVWKNVETPSAPEKNRPVMFSLI
jgi:hypothetical protein